MQYKLKSYLHTDDNRKWSIISMNLKLLNSLEKTEGKGCVGVCVCVEAKKKRKNHIDKEKYRTLRYSAMNL